MTFGKGQRTFWRAKLSRRVDFHTTPHGHNVKLFTVCGRVVGIMVSEPLGGVTACVRSAFPYVTVVWNMPLFHLSTVEKKLKIDTGKVVADFETLTQMFTLVWCTLPLSLYLQRFCQIVNVFQCLSPFYLSNNS